MENKFSERYINFSNKVNSLDLSKLSLEELLELKHECDDVELQYKNTELVVKADANSLYGSSASQYFSLYSFRLAEDITRTGKHFTVIVDRAMNRFFQKWNENPENLKKIQQFYPDVVSLKNFENYQPDTINDLCCYGDTDSRYFRIDLVYKMLIGSDGKSKQIPKSDKELGDFSVFIDEHFCSKIIKETIEEDCKFRNARIGFMKMGHETTARRSTFIKKKKYIMNVIWADDKMTKKLKFTGVELKKGSTSEKAKKILNHLVVKYIQEEISLDEMRIECLKIFKYVKTKKDKNLIYLLSSVSGLDNIKLVDGKYVSDKTHIQIQLALSWMNFIKENGLEDKYQKPFEGQKMQYYNCDEKSGYKVIGIPDDIDINTIPNLPEPDWNTCIIKAIIKPICRYIINKDEITDIDVEHFLMGIKSLSF